MDSLKDEGCAMVDQPFELPENPTAEEVSHYAAQFFADMSTCSFTANRRHVVFRKQVIECFGQQRLQAPVTPGLNQPQARVVVRR